MRTGGRVLIADDHPLAREGLALAVRSALPGVTVTSAGTIAEASRAIEISPPDRMILLDLMLPDARGYSGLMLIQHLVPKVPTVIVSAREDRSLVEAARAIGAAGFLYKSLPLDVLAARLREVDAGGTVFPPETAISRNATDMRDRIAELSPAQRVVLLALADGRSNKAIAYDLDITEATVKAHLTAIFKKLGVTNRAQALIAMQPIFGVGAGDGDMP